MPDYFWLLLILVAALCLGFVSGYWLNYRNRIEDLRSFRDRLDKITHRSNLLKDLLQPPNASPQVRAKTFNANRDSADGLLRDLESVNDQLERIISLVAREDFKKVANKNQSTSITQHKLEDEDFFRKDGVDVAESLRTSPRQGDESPAFKFSDDSLNPYAQITQLYNQGVDDRTARDKFRNEYPIIRLGNNKAVEQRLGEVGQPEFRKLDNGNFLAVPKAQGTFYVLPWFDSTLNSSAYNEGGFSHVFVCPSYEPESAYTVLRVKRPAIFRQDGDTWTRVEKGELILQR